MTKKLWLVLTLLIIGCGGRDELGTAETPPKTHSFAFENQTWQITTPSDWQVLPNETQVMFMAQKGSQNIVILERDVLNEDPVEQIISSAENQFFDFTLNERSGSRWQFTGQPGPTNTPRTFWQEVKVVPDARKFLLGSCSQIAGSPNGSQCAAVLNSWAVVVAEG